MSNENIDWRAIGNIHDMNEDGFVSDKKENLKNYSKEMAYTTFFTACKSGQLDIVQYFLTSPKFSKQFSNKFLEEGFRKAFENEHLNILEYLIFDRNIERAMTVDDFLTSYLKSGELFKLDTSPYVDKVKNMFTIRELNKKLQAELASTPSQTKKNKI